LEGQHGTEHERGDGHEGGSAPADPSAAGAALGTAVERCEVGRLAGLPVCESLAGFGKVDHGRWASSDGGTG
jgi:hypothetical protein